jgi:hypothetical protein
MDDSHDFKYLHHMHGVNVASHLFGAGVMAISLGLEQQEAVVRAVVERDRTNPWAADMMRLENVCNAYATLAAHPGNGRVKSQVAGAKRRFKKPLAADIGQALYQRAKVRKLI